MNEVDLGGGALAGVALAGVVSAVLSLLVLRRWSDQAAIARARSQAQAHLLEFRLFREEPWILLRAQRALLADNLRLMALLWKPVLLLAVPTLLLLWQLDALLGHAPVRPGEAAVVSWQGAADRLDAPQGVAVETGAVHIAATGETDWRIRPERAMAGRLRVEGEQRRMVAGEGVAYLPEPLWGGRLQIHYPRATIYGWHWLVWFLLISAAATLGLRRPLGVEL